MALNKYSLNPSCIVRDTCIKYKIKYSYMRGIIEFKNQHSDIAIREAFVSIKKYVNEANIII